MNKKLELIDGFLEYKLVNQGRSERTIYKYRKYLLDMAEHFKDQDILLLTRDEIEYFAGRVMFDKGLGARSRQGVVAALKGFYRWCRLQGHINSDPTQGLEYPNAGKPLPVAMTLDSAQRLMWAPDLSTFLGVRDAAMLSILIGCGLRVSGLVGINESDLIAEGGDENRISIKVKEKGDRERYIPMPKEAEALVVSYLGHPELGSIDRTLESGDKVLFVTVQNRVISPDKYHGEQRRLSTRAAYSVLAKHGKKARIPTAQLHPHALRHLFGAELQEDETGIGIAQTLMGHADPKSTMIYKHLAVRRLRQTIDKSNPLAKIKTPVTDLVRRS